MAITEQIPIVVYTGNGATTSWPYEFRIPAAEAVIVSIFNAATNSLVEIVDAADFTITGLGNDAGGIVTYPLSGSPLPPTQKLVIQRNVAYVSELSVTNQSGFLPELLTAQLDLTTMQIQQLNAQLARAVVVSPTTNLQDIQQLISAVAIVAEIEADVVTTAANSISITTAADNIASIIAAPAAATAAADSASNAATSETNAAISATNAATFDPALYVLKAAIDISNTDLNALVNSGSGYFVGNNLTNSPSGSGRFFVQQIVEFDGVNHRVAQIAWAALNTGWPIIWVRSSTAGSFSAWSQTLNATSEQTISGNKTHTGELLIIGSQKLRVRSPGSGNFVAYSVQNSGGTEAGRLEFDPSISTFNFNVPLRVQGNAIGITTPWVAYTPTFTAFGTVSGVTARSRRVGGNLQGIIRFVTGTVTASQARVSLGFNGTDGGVAVASWLNGLDQICGQVAKTTVGAVTPNTLMTGGDAFVKFGVQSASRAAGIPYAASDIFNNSEAVTLWYDVPIQGWS